MITSMLRRAQLSGDGSTLSLDFTTGILDPRLTFTRSTSGTYIGADGLVKTATANTARFDYDPTTLAPRGLLIEGSAVNLALYSQSFTSGIGWFFSGTGTKSTTNNYATAPDGTTTAARLQLGQNCSIKQNAGTTGVNHTVSIWVKSNTGSNQTITFWTGTAAANRTATTSWTRIEAVVNNASAALFDLYNPNASDCDILIWGAQLETGSGASSYIPTGASQGNRGQDLVSITSTDFSSWWLSSNPLSMWFDMAATGRALTNGVFRVADASGSAYGYQAYWYGTSFPIQLRATISGPVNSDISLGTVAANTRTKFAYTINSAAVKRFKDGSLVNTVSTPTLPPDPMSRFYFGGYTVFGGASGDFHLRGFKYWPIVLPDSQIISLTT